MKKYIIAVALLTAAAGAMAQNLSLQLGQTGYYGSIDLGNLNRPPVIYQEPMVIQMVPQYRNAAPIYLRVPPGHAKKWSKHCGSWYNNTYAPHYRKTHGGGGHDDQRSYRDDDRGDKHEGKGHKDKGHKDKGHKDKGHGNGKH